MSNTLEVEHSVALAPLTTIRLGGVADTFIRCTTVKQVAEAIAYAKSEQLALHILGGGSNTIFADEGFRGVVIKIEIPGIEFREEGEDVLMTVGAGEVWTKVVDMAVEKGYAGIECLAGIPGLVGATPMQNVGAYGQDVSQTISEVKAIDIELGQEVVFTNTDCKFAYRMSRFKGEDAGKYVITHVVFRLKINGQATIRYDQVKDAHVEKFGDVELPSGAQGLKQVRDIVVGLRKRKSMIVAEDDPHSRSCGSFFTNPTVSSAEAADIYNRLSCEPFGYESKGMVKLSAAALVEKSGFTRGQKFGNIGISPNHSLALVNYGGTSVELLNVARMIQSKVKEVCGIELEREPVAVKA